MSKFASFAEYPPRSLAGAEAASLTAWASLKRFHDDLVLVGGLAIKYLTKHGPSLLPGPVTMDVDFGVTLTAEGGQYGSMADDLTGQGFNRDKKGRYVRQFETMSVFIDFLTEHPTASTGAVGVDGVRADLFPGIARALATRRKVAVQGKDLFGVRQKISVPVSGIGPLLVLKLNAFAGRQQPKDAYDVLLGLSRFVEGPEAAIAAFQTEASAGNRGYARAIETLRRHFVDAAQSGPIRCATFALDGQPGIDDRPLRERQIVEQLVTIGRALARERWRDCHYVPRLHRRPACRITRHRVVRGAWLASSVGAGVVVVVVAAAAVAGIGPGKLLFFGLTLAGNVKGSPQPYPF